MINTVLGYRSMNTLPLADFTRPSIRCTSSLLYVTVVVIEVVASTSELRSESKRLDDEHTYACEHQHSREFSEHVFGDSVSMRVHFNMLPDSSQLVDRVRSNRNDVPIFGLNLVLYGDINAWRTLKGSVDVLMSYGVLSAVISWINRSSAGWHSCTQNKERVSWSTK